MTKHVRELQKLLPDGLAVDRVGNGKHPITIVFIATGEPLRTEHGMRVCVATSPSDHRAVRNLLAQVRVALRREGGRA